MSGPAMNPPPSSARRAPYRYLGCFRLVLASLVMLQHAGSLLPPAVGALLRPLEVGGIAVFCFFILSGFVIAEAVDVFYARRPGDFLLNRLLRLAPTYVVAIFLTAAVLASITYGVGPAAEDAITPASYAPRTIALNLLALFPIWKIAEAYAPVPELLEQAWALRIEIMFYVATAAAVGAATLGRIAVGNLLTVLGLGTLLATTSLGSPATGSFLENGPYFVFGVAFYYAVSRRERLLPGAFCTSACAFAAASLLQRAAVFGPTSLPRDRLGELFFLTVLTLTFVVLVGVRERKGRAAVKLARLDRSCGDLTYPLYLLHDVILVAARALLPHGRWFSVVLAFTIAFAVSGLAVAAVERPIARLRTLVRKRHKPTVFAGAIRPAAS